MTPPPPHHPDTPDPEDEHETPDVSTVPQGAVAVFQAPRAIRPGGTVPPANATPAQPSAQPANSHTVPPADAPLAQPGASRMPQAGPNGQPASRGPVPQAGPNGQPASHGPVPPVQPNGRPEIESPFLDLFGAEGRHSRHSTVDGTVVAESRADAVPPSNGEVVLRGRPAVAPPPPPPPPLPMPSVPAPPALTAPAPALAARPATVAPLPADTPDWQPATPTQPVEAWAFARPPELQPAEAWAFVRPAEAQPAEAQPAEAQPAQGWPVEAQPAMARPVELWPAEAPPFQAPSAEASPFQAWPVEAAPADVAPDATRPDDPAEAAHAAPAHRRTRERSKAAGKPKTAKPAPQPTTKRPKHKDRDPAQDLAITEIAGHLTYTPNTVTAWYWLPEVRWAFRPDGEREALLMAIAEQYAGLAGFRLHLRRTTRPFPADEWARTVDQMTPTPLPSVAGAPSWADHLVAAQHHLLSVNHAEGQTYLGITFARRTLGDTMSARIRNIFGRGITDGEHRRMARMVEQFDEVLGSFGMRGRRVTVAELEWLLYRSVALCMAPPERLSPVTSGEWQRGDLLALTEQIERYRTPYGSTVKLVNRLTGEERHVAILAVGRMEPLEIPERHEPWLHFHERLPWPMEISSRIDVLGPGDSFRNLEHRLRMIRSQQLDYAEHGMDSPPELERLAQRALHIGDDMTTGLPTDASRMHGWHRIAISGRTRDECLERSRRLIQIYSRELRISLQHPKQQEWLAREFIPGEPIANTGYLRRMPVKLFAAALPQAASNVGDRRGDLIGRTAGTCRRPVFLDLHFPMEVRERSGLAVFVAEPGGGKSTLMGALGYLAARRGIQVTLLDPSGPLARLAAMPELRPYSRVLNLTGSEQGTLAPYALIPTPLRPHFPEGPVGDREYEIAISNARAERRMLVQDICSMLVPPQVAKEASTATLLRHAVREVPAEEASTVDDVVNCLRAMDSDDAHELSNLLLDTAEMPLARLFFGTAPPEYLQGDAALTVITMAGLRLPDLKIEREYWSAEEALALPMLHTAHRLAVRRCYGGSMSSRKLVGLDEAHFMEGWRSGRSFLVRLARDSRKWNIAGLVASQNPKDILGLDVQNLVSTVFVGRIAEDAEIASDALRLLRVPTDVGYEQTLASLSNVDTSSQARLGFREFVMRDVDGRVQKVRVDVSYVPDLLTYLDTTPAMAAPAPVPLNGPVDEPEV